jgi:hypothetical protein
MEVTNPCKVYLSNAEVYNILKQQQKERTMSDQTSLAATSKPVRREGSMLATAIDVTNTRNSRPHSEPISKKLKVSENVHTIEYEVLMELDSCKLHSIKSLTSLIKALKNDRFGLSMLEVLQIVNLLPKSFIDLYVLIEDVDSRLEESILQEILHIIIQYTNQ